MLHKDPHQCHLACCGIALVCYGFDFLHDFKILHKVCLGKPRQQLLSIILVEIRRRMISTKIIQYTKKYNKYQGRA